MREKFQGFAISLTAEPDGPGVQQETLQTAKTLSDYFNHYHDLNELVDPVFEKTIEGGYIDLPRAAALAAWLDRHPLICALYPYRQLHQALAVATAEGGWSEETERGLLQFFAALPDAFELVQLPAELFGDMYTAIFDQPSAPLEMAGHYVEVTGPCSAGSHTAMYRIAEQHGARRSKGFLRSGYMFVARSHIEERIVSSKIEAAVASRMKHGGLLILSEDHFPMAD